jgi:hypothetical protein
LYRSACEAELGYRLLDGDSAEKPGVIAAALQSAGINDLGNPHLDQ